VILLKIDVTKAEVDLSFLLELKSAKNVLLIIAVVFQLH